MILTREVDIKVTEGNFDYFTNFGYTNISIGNKINIPIELLPKGSNRIIKCECDGCGVTKDIIFKNYIKYDNQWGFYYCRKCSEPKRKEALYSKYGVEYPLQSGLCMLKYKQTLCLNFCENSVTEK